MKKIIKTLLVVMVLALAITALVACEKEAEKTTTPEVTECQHTGGTATCTEAAVCELCGESYGEFGHIGGEATCTEAPVCEVCGESYDKPNGHTVEYYGEEYYCEKEGLSAGASCTTCGKVIRKRVPLDPTGHNIVGQTCTEPGVCANPGCEYTVDALGHDMGEATCITPATCQRKGCGHTEGEALGHDMGEATCTAPATCKICGATEGEALGHTLIDVEAKAATCTEAGYNAHKVCENCDYTEGKEDIEALGHVDEDLDITCDHEGCTKRILPDGDTKISLFTANHMVIVSLTNNYYVEGKVTSVENAKNGKFIITDEAGDTILIYLPVDENGTTHANWTSKVVVGDVVSVYGKPVNPAGLSTDQKAAIKSGVLTFISKHPHVFGEPTCTKPGYCECGQDGPEALGHADTDGNDLCDVCGWNVTYYIETVGTKYSDIKDTDKADTTNGVATFEGVGFNVVFEKGTSSFNTNGTDHMRMNRGNKVTIQALKGDTIVGLMIAASSSTYVDELELFLQAAGYEYTVDGVELIIYFDATQSITIDNTSTKAQRIASIKVIYVPAPKPDPITVVMDNTITDTQTSYMTGNNDAELLGLDPTIFTVVGNKGSYSNNVTLYYKSSLAAPSQIRLFNHSSANGNSITVSVADGYEIVSIKITFAITGRANGYIITDASGNEIANVATDATIENVEVEYDVNSGSFTLKNVHTGSSKQIWIDSIEIVYQPK